jgi:hypothetical protein
MRHSLSFKEPTDFGTLDHDGQFFGFISAGDVLASLGHVWADTRAWSTSPIMEKNKIVLSIEGIRSNEPFEKKVPTQNWVVVAPYVLMEYPFRRISV